MPKSLGLVTLTVFALMFAVVVLLPFLAMAQVPVSDVVSVSSASPVVLHSPAVAAAVHNDISLPLLSLPPAPRQSGQRVYSVRPLPRPSSGSAVDPVLQTFATPLVATTASLNIAGVGNGDYGFVPNAAPPDTNGAVGDTQYVQWVNESFAVFDKTTGALVYGPAAGNTLWSGFGGGCETNNDGDPIVQYDKAANRWVLTQFSVTTTPFLQCVAVSTTSDATGTYARYAFSQLNFPDYPKLGVWSDGYYISFNMFSGVRFVGGRACAFDRSAMLAGAPAGSICFQLGSAFGGLLPSDLDGATAPPTGSPNFYLAFGSNSLDLWKFHADFVTPANSTFSGPTNIPVAAFAAACSGGGTCIPQQGTSQQLDSKADRLMYRLAYRNFGDHESLVVNHSVTAGSSVGVRWYELRSPNATPTVFQQGTYAPDSDFRWMGSIAMDKAGNIAVGYSVSSGSIKPTIRYTGRVPGDPLGTLQAENTIINGAGAQNGGLNRWGDYSAMTIDPSDDCTFFYTNEYLKADGSFNWSTQIASFKFPSCTNAPPVLTTITVAPSSASVQTGGTQQFTATGYDQFGIPMSPQPAFSWSVSGGGTISASGLFTAGSTTGGPFTVTAASGSVSGTASVTVTSPPVLTTITISPSSASVQTGGTQQFTATGFDQFGNPMSPQPTFSWSVSGGGTISASGLFTAGSTTGGPFTVTASSGSVSGTASVTVTSPPNDFSISANPVSLSIVQGTSGTSTISTAVTSGSAGTVALTVSGAPSGASTSLSPTSVTAGNSSTLTVNAGSAAAGTYTLTVTGTEGTATHSASVTLTVTSPPPNDFSISANPVSLSIVQGTSGTSTISTAVTSGSAGTVALTVSGAPSGASTSLSPTSVTAGNSSTLTVNAGSAAAGTYTLTVTGTEGSNTHSTTVSVTVTAPPDFSVSASPTSLAVARGSSGTSTISTAALSGFNSAISLSASGQGSRVTVSFSPNPIPAPGTGSSVMTITAARNARKGTTTIAVTGTGGGVTHSTTVTLTIQ